MEPALIRAGIKCRRRDKNLVEHWLRVRGQVEADDVRLAGPRSTGDLKSESLAGLSYKRRKDHSQMGALLSYLRETFRMVQK